MQVNCNGILCAAIFVVMLPIFGCFSISRYEANVRPDTVRPSMAIKGKYRLAKVDVRENIYYSDYWSDYSLCGQGVEMYFNAIQKALIKNYPSVFSDSREATPITVLLTWSNNINKPHSYGGVFLALGYPSVQEMEVTYGTRIILNATDKSIDELWEEYKASVALMQKIPAQNGVAVRQREMWTSFFIPISLIGIYGDSDWPTKRRLFTSLQHAEDYKTDKWHYWRRSWYYEYHKEFVFDPVSDGDVIAALIMRSLNKIHDSE